MAFLLVYIQEAHTDDGWQMPENVDVGLVCNQPADYDTRLLNARTCRAKLDLTMPMVVDTMNNDVDNLYAGFPERMFVIGGDGTISYSGRMGPWGFKPEDVDLALVELAAQAADEKLGAK